MKEIKTIKYVVGNPASGKSRLIHNSQYDFFDNDNYALVDCNNYKDYNLINKITQQEIHNKSVEKANEHAKNAIMCDKNLVVELTISGFMKSVKNGNLTRIKSRGYFIEVYFIMRDLGECLKSNNERYYPTPYSVFVEDDSEFIKIAKENSDAFFSVCNYSGNSLYSRITMYKGFRTEQEHNSKIAINGKALLDFNAIHFTSDIEIAKLYGDYVYEVVSTNKIYKYGKIFYSSSIIII